MKLTTNLQINYAPVAAAVIGAFCWLGVYAVYANFAHRGLELLQRPDIISSLKGSLLLGLYAAGVLLLVACGIGTIVVLIKSMTRGDGHEHSIKADPPL